MQLNSVRFRCINLGMCQSGQNSLPMGLEATATKAMVTSKALHPRDKVISLLPGKLSPARLLPPALEARQGLREGKSLPLLSGLITS